MSAHDEPSYMAFARASIRDNDGVSVTVARELVARIDRDASALKAAQPRTINRPGQLEALPFGSAVQTSDESDTVVLRCEGRAFRNQSGGEVSVEDLWRYGTHPFVVIYEPGVQA